MSAPRLILALNNLSDRFWLTHMRHKMTTARASRFACLLACAMAACASSAADILIRSFQPEQPLSRALRPAPVTAVLENTGSAPVEVRAKLILPGGVETVRAQTGAKVRIEGHSEARIGWELKAQSAGPCDLGLEVNSDDASLATATLPMRFLAAAEQRKIDYIPDPVPAKTQVLIGAHHCPLWEADKFRMWDNVLKHPERTPALGFYAQENPQVSDWETKWAVEHGVSFFIYCWYRASQGGPVQTRYSSAINDALFKSRFADKMRFTIMWENQSRGTAGVADEHDLMSNLLPYWIETYFKHPSYLKIDNRPVLFVYRPEYLVQDLGSKAAVARAFDKMRQACKDAGFAGLTILGEYRGIQPEHLRLLKDLGLDYTFAYCWGIPNSPTPKQAIQTQLGYIRKTHELGVLPQVVTVSQAWSGWRDEGSIWKIPPVDFEDLLREAKAFIATLPPDQLGSKMLLLDNWNEWGEGHYIAPYREYGFGYLDAVRTVFADVSGPHEDLIPEDIGLGPYDTAYRTHAEREKVLRKKLSQKITKTGADASGLIGWWAFDEATNDTVTLDYSGHRLGGVLENAERGAGFDGRALVCRGGSARVHYDPSFSPTQALTIACWVKTDAAGQKHVWFVNRIFGGSTSSGFRLGLQDGKPCFGVPVTSFSHHLTGKALLPVGRWTHLAGTFDGAVMRLYMDGEEQGSLARPGPLKPNTQYLCLGNYDTGHAAHFTGWLDEVKFYSRALNAEEVRCQCHALSTRTEP